MGHHPRCRCRRPPTSAHSCELRIGSGCCRWSPANRLTLAGTKRSLSTAADAASTGAFTSCCCPRTPASRPATRHCLFPVPPPFELPVSVSRVLLGRHAALGCDQNGQGFKSHIFGLGALFVSNSDTSSTLNATSVRVTNQASTLCADRPSTRTGPLLRCLNEPPAERKGCFTGTIWNRAGRNEVRSRAQHCIPP